VTDSRTRTGAPRMIGPSSHTECIWAGLNSQVGDNLYAVARTIAALRQLDRDGTHRMVEAAFSGFKSLPATGGTAGSCWWTVLGVDPEATRRAIEDAYRSLAKLHHPDAGGDPGRWLELQDAIGQARQAKEE
jgi:DnaJ-domain-containing protein 1